MCLSKVKLLFGRTLEGDLLDIDILVTFLIQRPDGTPKYKTVRVPESETGPDLQDFLENVGNLAINQLNQDQLNQDQ